MGVPGGECMLELCERDADCHGGRQCVRQSICHVERTRHWREGPGEPDYRPRWVCGGKLSCRSPAECRPGKLCLDPGSRRAGDSPNPGDASEAAELPGSCSGCRRRQPVEHHMGVALLLVLGATVWRRRRRG
jgi:hypothetical protein